MPSILGKLAAFAALVTGLGVATASAAEPYHAAYNIGTGNSVLDFANVATAVPNNVLGEVIRRDRILKSALDGIEYRHHPFSKGADALPLIHERKIEAAILGDLPAMELLGVNAAVVYGLARQNYVVVVGPRGKTLADLKGQRIGYAPGTAAQYGVLQGLDNVTLGEKDVTFVPLPIGEMYDALLSGKVTAISIHEPLPSAILARHPDRFTALHKQISAAYLVVARPFAEAQPEATRQMNAAVARAIRWLRKDRRHLATAARWAIEGMAPFAGAAVSMSEVEIIRLTRDNILDIRGAPALPKNSLDENGLLAREFALMQRLGKLPPETRWENVKRNFDFSTVAAVLANPKKYRLDEFDYEK